MQMQASHVTQYVRIEVSLEGGEVVAESLHSFVLSLQAEAIWQADLTPLPQVRAEMAQEVVLNQQPRFAVQVAVSHEVQLDPLADLIWISSQPANPDDALDYLDKRFKDAEVRLQEVVVRIIQRPGSEKCGKPAAPLVRPRGGECASLWCKQSVPTETLHCCIR